MLPGTGCGKFFYKELPLGFASKICEKIFFVLRIWFKCNRRQQRYFLPIHKLKMFFLFWESDLYVIEGRDKHIFITGTT